MINDDLHTQWKKDEAAHFEGWDFSYIKDRHQEETPPWNYVVEAKELNPKVELVEIEGGGHRFGDKITPEEYNGKVQKFIESVLS